MDIVLRESDRLNETIRSFLAYARPQRNASTRIDVRQVVTDAATLLQNSPELLETHAIRCDVPAEPVWCFADEAQIRQIVWNLATNGLRAMTDGGTLTLSARYAPPEPDSPDMVTLAVTDEGIGIDAGRARRHPAAISRRICPRHGPRPVDRSPHRQRLRRGAADDVGPRQGHHGDRQAAARARGHAAKV